MSYFAIAAPQTVVLPNGNTLTFRVNPADSSQVEIHLTGERDGVKGTWVVPFRRNAGAAGIPEFAALPAAPSSDAPPNQARIDAMDDSHPAKAELKARQEAADNIPLDADGLPPADTKAQDPRVPRSPDGEYASASGATKVDPVHGVINGMGMDAQAAKPKEGTNADTPESDRKDQAAVGLKPAADKV